MTFLLNQAFTFIQTNISLEIYFYLYTLPLPSLLHFLHFQPCFSVFPNLLPLIHSPFYPSITPPFTCPLLLLLPLHYSSFYLSFTPPFTPPSLSFLPLLHSSFYLSFTPPFTPPSLPLLPLHHYPF